MEGGSTTNFGMLNRINGVLDADLGYMRVQVS